MICNHAGLGLRPLRCTSFRRPPYQSWGSAGTFLSVGAPPMPPLRIPYGSFLLRKGLSLEGPLDSRLRGKNGWGMGCLHIFELRYLIDGVDGLSREIDMECADSSALWLDCQNQRTTSRHAWECVIPAKAGIQKTCRDPPTFNWIPAFAGMTASTLTTSPIPLGGFGVASRMPSTRLLDSVLRGSCRSGRICRRIRRSMRGRPGFVCRFGSRRRFRRLPRG